MSKHRKRQHSTYPGNWNRKRGTRGRYLAKGFGERTWDDMMPSTSTRQILKRELRREMEDV